MKKTIIYFLRHGEVQNPNHILYGRLPRFPLSETGKKQIREVVSYFKKKEIKHIYTSPMLRTCQTAEIIGRQLGIRPKVSRLINEVRLIFAGVALEVYKSKFQSKLYSRKNIVKGQESIEEIADRMLSFLKIIKKRHFGEKILVVSHGDPIVILKAKTKGKDFTFQYKRDNYLKIASWFTLICGNDRYFWR